MKLISTALTKPSPFRCPLKTKSFLARTQRLNYFRPPAQKPSQSILTLRTRHFRAAQKNQVNFDPHTKTNYISIYTLNKTESEHTKTQSVSIPAFGFRMDNPSVLYTAWILYLD